jgi:hypothetical protein
MTWVARKRSQSSRPSPRKYTYVPQTKPIPSPNHTVSSNTYMPPPWLPSDEQLGSPPPPSPSRISKLPTDVVSGIRAITHGHGQEEQGPGTCVIFPLPLPLSLAPFVACDTVTAWVPPPTVRGADCVCVCVCVRVCVCARGISGPARLACWHAGSLGSLANYC